MIKGLNKGRWTRPTDKSAVYYEFESGKRWGLRVTLYEKHAKVEACQGEKAVWYNAPKRYSTIVSPPTIFEKLRGISFEDKVLAEVENKRKVVAEENGAPTYFTDNMEE
ncbi:MAG: hypothetical protein ACE3NC_07295 [Candidatus Wallacebacter cryptica]|mgnify:CR=1 FL=1|nr:hypothetical protein [Bacillota bacterium]